MSAPVGFVGLGAIGAPMAARLLDTEGGLVVCDAVPQACDALVSAGARAVGTPAEVAQAGAEVICVMVRDDTQVREVLAGVDGIAAQAAPGTVVLVHSTVHPDTAESLATLLATAGVDVLDAPVSGGALGAADGNLAVMVGGPDEAVARATPVLERLAGLVVHTGPVGSATRMKIARNLLTFTSFALAWEAQRLAEAAGVSLTRLARVVRHSDSVTGGVGAIMLRRTAAPMSADDPLRPVMEHTLALGTKDLDLALELAERLDVELPLTRRAAGRLAAALGLEPDPTDPAAPGHAHGQGRGQAHQAHEEETR